MEEVYKMIEMEDEINFEILKNKTQNDLHEMAFELHRANDSYRLHYLLKKFTERMQKYEANANKMVKELEEQSCYYHKR